MTSLRVTMCALIAVLVLTPFLGFATGEDASHIWNKHPRHASGHHPDASRFAWKATPGTLAPPPPLVVFTLVGLLSMDAPLVVPSAVSRPPFVPPRA